MLKIINKYILTVDFIFFFLIIFNLQKIFFANNENFNSFSKSVKKERGKIFDRNGELIATNIDTKDFYIDTRKILNKTELKKNFKIFSLIKKKITLKIFFQKNNTLK